MKAADAFSLLGLGNVTEATYAEAKQAFRRVSMKHHPDRNPDNQAASNEAMKAITEAWRTLEALFKINDVVANYSAGTEKQADDYGEELYQAINAIIDIEGLIIEVCGSWVWVSGDTKTHKAALKQAGFKWANKKKQWHFRPDNYKSKSRGNYSMDEIREKYGTNTPKKGEKPKTKALNKAA